MIRRFNKRLVLRRESLRLLEREHLKQVGGQLDNSDGCTVDCPTIGEQSTCRGLSCDFPCVDTTRCP